MHWLQEIDLVATAYKQGEKDVAARREAWPQAVAKILPLMQAMKHSFEAQGIRCSIENAEIAGLNILEFHIDPRMTGVHWQEREDDGTRFHRAIEQRAAIGYSQTVNGMMARWTDRHRVSGLDGNDNPPNVPVKLIESIDPQTVNEETITAHLVDFAKMALSSSYTEWRENEVPALPIVQSNKIVN